MSKRLLTMKSFLFISFALTAALGLVEGRAFAPRSKISSTSRSNSIVLEKQLSVRGGAGPLDAELATKIYGGILLAQGVSGVLAPGPTMKSFEFPAEFADEPRNQWSARRANLAMTSVGALIFALQFMDYSSNTAHAFVAVIWCAEWLHSALNGNKYTGMEGEYVGLALALSALYGSLTDASWNPIALKAIYAYALLGGITCFLPSVESARKIWNAPPATIKSSPFELVVLRNIGFNLFCLGIMGVFLVFKGKDIVTATGYTALAGLLCFVKYLALDEIPSETSKVPLAIWMSILSLVIYSTLF